MDQSNPVDDVLRNAAHKTAYAASFAIADNAEAYTDALKATERASEMICLRTAEGGLMIGPLSNGIISNVVKAYQNSKSAALDFEFNASLSMYMAKSARDAAAGAYNEYKSVYHAAVSTSEGSAINSTVTTIEEIPCDEVIYAESEGDIGEDDEKEDEDGTQDKGSKTSGTGAAAPGPSIFRLPGKGFKTSTSERGETSEEEHRRLRSDEQINGINKPLNLGPNVDGITPMRMEPMTVGDRLIRITAPKCIDRKAAMKHMTKTLATTQSLQTGRGDISGLCHWKQNGSVYDQDLPAIDSHPFYNASTGQIETMPMICDSMTNFALDSNQDLPYSTICHSFFYHCGLDGKGLAPRDGVHEHYAIAKIASSSVPLPTLCMENDKYVLKNDAINCKYKIQLADVGIPKLGLILRMLRYASGIGVREMNELNHLEKQQRESEVRKAPDYNVGVSDELLRLRADIWANLPPRDFVPALIAAAQMRFANMDLTSDMRGTLNADQLTAAMKAKSISCLKHTCGRNTVKLEPQYTILKDQTEILCTGLTVYNKFCETMTSFESRSDEIGQKWNKALNPSTVGLKAAFRDAQFYRNGMTRAETRHSSTTAPDREGKRSIGGNRAPSTFVPSIEELIAAHTKFVSLVVDEWPEFLVRCSFQNHIQQIEGFIAGGCPTGVYFGDMAVLKSAGVTEGMSKREANKQPNGFIVHFFNSLTRKFIGTTVHSKVDKNGGTSINGFTLFLRNLAWGGLIGQKYTVYMCVAGPGACITNSCEEATVLTGKGYVDLNNYYFRCFSAEVITDDTAGQGINNPRLLWLSGKTGQFTGPELRHKKYQDADTDLRLIGVDNSQLSSIKLGIMRLNFTGNHDDMGGYRIELQREDGAGSAFNLHDTDGTAITESKRIECDTTVSIVPDTPINKLQCFGIEVSLYCYQSTRIKIRAGGDWYKVPRDDTAKLQAALEASWTKHLLVVRRVPKPNGRSGILWELHRTAADGKISKVSSADRGEGAILQQGTIPEGNWLEILELCKLERQGHVCYTVRLRLEDRDATFRLPDRIGEKVTEYIKSAKVDTTVFQGWSLHRKRSKGEPDVELKCNNSTTTLSCGKLKLGRPFRSSNAVETRSAKRARK